MIARTTTTKITAAGLAGAALLLAAQGAQAAPSPFDGTWRTDMSSVTFSRKPEEHRLKNGVASCVSCTPPYSARADGAFHPVAGRPEMDAVMFKVVDDRTVEETDRKAGRDVSFTHAVASPDGKTLTLDWRDMTNPNTPVATGRAVVTRVGPRLPGEHATSGAFVQISAQASAEAVSQTLKLQGGVLKMTTPTGQSYSAEVGGPAAPFKGAPTVDTVKVVQAGPRELIETDMLDGKVVGRLRMRVSPDGKTLMLDGEDLKSGRKTSAKASRG